MLRFRQFNCYAIFVIVMCWSFLVEYISNQQKEMQEASQGLHNAFEEVKDALDKADEGVQTVKGQLDVLKTVKHNTSLYITYQ